MRWRSYSPCVVRTWVRALAGGFAAAVLIGGGQLGVAYSFGVLRWDQTFEAGAENGWNVHLTWVAYIAMLAVVGGAVAGVRPLRRNDFDGLGAWMAVALAALAGAGAVVPLVALPAGAAEVPRPLDPALSAGLAAGLGAAVGFFAALAVLSARALATSVFVVAGWVWLLGLGSALASLDGPSLPAGLRLGVLTLPQLPHRETQNLVLPMMVGLALLTGAAIAGSARWLDEHRFTVATSGLAGPALVASAYLIAGPGISADDGEQLVPWRAALIAVGAGLAASTLVALIPARRGPTDGDRTDDRTDEDRPGSERAGHVRSRSERADPERVDPERADTERSRSERAGDEWFRDETRPPAPTARPDSDHVDWVSGLRRE